ncbi:MAG: arginase family protein [Actinomycetales bacterium]|nr:arginase family protein [Actinomycetales bacterium]
MAVTFLVVPQWQGSGSARALQVVDGARAIAGDLPAASTIEVEVPLEAGDDEGTGIHRFSSLRIVRQRIAQALEHVDGPVVAIGGDCAAEYAAIAHAAARHRLAVLWLDAHPDANTPSTSPSGAFNGMVLRALVDDRVVDASSVVIAGARAWDPEEERWVAAEGVASLDVDALREPATLADAVAATGADAVYLHVDLDVLDPAEIRGLGYPEPFGVTVAELLAAIRAVRERLPLAGAGVMEYAPGDAEAVTDDMPTILRVVGALTSGI